MSRPFQFYPEKAIEAVAFLLRRERGHRMNYMRLLKVLYIAEREILAESSTPLTRSTVVAMERGPVLEDVLHLIRGEHSATDKWAAYIQVDRYQLEMVRDPGVKLLSRYVSRKLEEVASRYENFDEWDMVEVTHKLPEWERNNPGTSSKRDSASSHSGSRRPAGRLRENRCKCQRGRVGPSFFHEPAIPGSFVYIVWRCLATFSCGGLARLRPCLGPGCCGHCSRQGKENMIRFNIDKTIQAAAFLDQAETRTPRKLHAAVE